MIKINRITCGCETFISAMLLHSDLNKWRLTELTKNEIMYINVASTRLLQRSKKDYGE